MSLVGDLAERAFDDLRFDSFVMGVGGIDLGEGLNPSSTLTTCRVKTCVDICSPLHRRGRSHEDRKSRVLRIAPLDRVDVLATDRGGDTEVLEGFRSADVEVVMV